MQWRFNPPAAQPGTRYALRKQNQIIVYLFEENGFSIVFMGPNSGLSGCYTLGRARAHYWTGGILSQTLLVNITGQFSLIFSIVDRYNIFCSKETNCVCVFSARIWEYPPLRRAGQASLWPNSNDPPWSGWWRGGVRWCGAARAPLINTSAHVLQIQLCHFQFSNCPRGPAAATPPPSQPSTASTTKLKQKGF